MAPLRLPPKQRSPQPHPLRRARRGKGRLQTNTCPAFCARARQNKRKACQAPPLPHVTAPRSAPPPPFPPLPSASAKAVRFSRLNLAAIRPLAQSAILCRDRESNSPEDSGNQGVASRSPGPQVHPEGFAHPSPRCRRPRQRRPTPLSPPLRRRPLACWVALAALRRRTFGSAVVGAAEVISRCPPASPLPGASLTRLQSAPRSRPGCHCRRGLTVRPLPAAPGGSGDGTLRWWRDSGRGGAPANGSRGGAAPCK